MIEALQRVPTETIEAFLLSHNADKVGIPQQLADYILQINEAANLNRKYSSITECAKKLQRSYPDLSISTCKSRIYDAINYFNSDCSVTAESWNLFFADEMMKLREVNLVAHDLKEARLCTERAREYRIAASNSAVPKDLTKFRTQLVSPDLELDRMGVKEKGVLASYKRALEIIDSRDISSSDKTRLKAELGRELNIQEIGEETDES